MPRALLSPLLVVLLVACSARSVSDEAGSSTSSESGSSESGGSTGETTVGPETETETSEDGDGDPSEGGCSEPIKLDLPADGEAAPDSCTVEPIAWPSPAQWPGCELCELENPCAFEAFLGCVTPPEGTECKDLCFGGDCIGVYWTDCEGEGPIGWNDQPDDTCGVYEIEGRCCTIGKFLAYCAE